MILLSDAFESSHYYWAIDSGIKKCQEDWEKVQKAEKWISVLEIEPFFF